LKSNSEEVKE